MIVRLLFITLCFGLAGCSTLAWQNTMTKIKFDMNQLDQDGLRGDKGSLRSLSYEFCIPDKINYVDEVMAIDKTLVVYKESPGRIQCSESEYLGIGDTNQVGYREVLRNLAELDFVKEIHEATFE